MSVSAQLLRLARRVAHRRPGKDEPRAGWRAAIGQAVQDLESLNRSTEQDFLAVGEKLTDCRSAAHGIAADMASLTELFSEAHLQNASQALAGMLEHSRQLDARIERSGQALAQLHDLSPRVRGAFAGLRTAVSVFRALCTLTRIETARLGGTGADFGDLATEVGPLSEKIQSSGEAALEASAELDRAVQSAIRSGSDLRARQLHELPELIAGVISGLEACAERRERAVKSSARQAAQYAALGEAVDGVVGSIQVHDITRQQIEHVALALRQLLPAPHRRGKDGDIPRAEARGVLRLQSAQLAGAAGVFATSVERMERDLESIAAQVREMAETSRALMGISADDQDSFFLQMEGRFTAILKHLGACTAEQEELGATAAGLAGTVGKMRDSVAEIRGIEIRLQRIATNAAIRAAHIGAAGNALNVIAGLIYGLARESNANTEDAAVALDAMRDAAGRVSAGSDGGSITNDIVGEMRRAILELHTSSESSFSRVNQIAASGERLATDMSAVRGAFSAGRLFAGVVDRVRGEIERFGGQDGPEPLESAEGADGQWDSLTGRYTMQMERDVHESVTQGPVIAAAAVEEPPKTDGDLGDNVELF